ncbi:putative bifunctional diguanylate cyclase/phosphodiesterase [Sphingomonas montana]|uniref:putative bifunctional diguanylate cyclase/phosphodiesterase n=1 Tax=Sphingomonas montana TaxID=1843236 RepID=UPI001F0A4E01|nr:GGDEF domain-containing phosphodiesterase [Sphingomonas montana]
MTIGAARQSFLEALPIPTAIVEVCAGVMTLRHYNTHYATGVDTAAEGLLERPALVEAVCRFAAGDAGTNEFDWIDGNAIDGQHYRIRLARLFRVKPDIERLMVSALNRTAEVESRRSLQAEMTHDSLTGLPNRTAFVDALADAVEDAAPGRGEIEGAAETGNDGGRVDMDGRGVAGFAVLIVDLARFSRVNECLGSMVGDELIITVARRLVGTVRSGDMLARIGGDEFAILLRLGHDVEDAMLAAHRIQAALAAPFRLSEMEIRVDCAIGCAVPDGQAPQAGDLFRNAQFAVKRAKLSGRIELFQPGEVNAVRRQFRLETELRRAIENDRLTLAFQPLIDLRTGAISGFEALARWHDPQRGPIEPSEFIPVAEESGLILPLGRWAIAAAARTLAGWDRTAGHRMPVNVCVNISAVQIQRDDVSATVAAVLGAHDVAGRLKLELTESCIVADPERAMRVLHALKEQDVRIAMDDFGTGYSSLAYLQKLPIDELKIDRSFVTPMLRDRDSLAIVRAVLSLAAALGMSTTAEGVETMELAQTLSALGCTLGQGWYYGRPLTAEAAYAYWAARC